MRPVTCYCMISQTKSWMNLNYEVIALSSFWITVGLSQLSQIWIVMDLAVWFCIVFFKFLKRHCQCSYVSMHSLIFWNRSHCYNNGFQNSSFGASFPRGWRSYLFNSATYSCEGKINNFCQYPVVEKHPVLEI